MGGQQSLTVCTRWENLTENTRLHSVLLRILTSHLPNHISWKSEELMPHLSEHTGVSGSLTNVKAKKLLQCEMSTTGCVIPKRRHQPSRLGWWCDDMHVPAFRALQHVSPIWTRDCMAAHKGQLVSRKSHTNRALVQFVPINQFRLCSCCAHSLGRWQTLAQRLIKTLIAEWKGDIAGLIGMDPCFRSNYLRRKEETTRIIKEFGVGVSFLMDLFKLQLQFINL